MHIPELVASIRAENALNLVMLEQPNMKWQSTLKDLIPFDATHIHQ